MKLSILVFGARRPQQLVPFGGAVKWGGAERLWFGQSTTLDSFHLASWLAGLGMDVPIGFGVTLMPLKSPQQAAIEARSMAAVTGHDVVVGFGPGSVELQEGILGQAYDKPITAMREYVESVRYLLGQLDDDELGRLTTEREYFPLPGGPLPPIPGPDVEVGLGVLRPRMATLVGESADCGITWLLPANHLRDVIAPRMAEAAEARSRRTPRLVAIVPFALEAEGRDSTHLAMASLGQHLDEPHYRAAVQDAGIPIQGESIEHDCRLTVEHDLFLYGSPREVAAKLDEYEAAGVDEVVLNVSGVAEIHGLNHATLDIRNLLEFIEAREPVLR